MTREETIADITCRLVEYYHPERIYLFGSAARGDGGLDSDLDFCVVLPDDAPERLYRPGIHRALWDVDTATDVVRWPVSDFDARAAQVKASLPATIVHEGKLLYDARPPRPASPPTMKSSCSTAWSIPSTAIACSPPAIASPSPSPAAPIPSACSTSSSILRPAGI
jgi:hypothetical protein